MDNAFVSSWDIPVMITILREIIKILHEKMLNVIYLYWFHTDTSEKNKSLTDHSNEPLSYLLSSKIFLVSGSPFLEMILRLHMFHFSYFSRKTPFLRWVSHAAVQMQNLLESNLFQNSVLRQNTRDYIRISWKYCKTV